MIRAATLKDIPALTELAKEFYEMGPFAENGLNFQETSFMFMAASMIQSPKEKVVLVAEDKTAGIVGMLGAYISPWFCDFHQAQVVESWFYVKPDYRKHGTAKKLLKELEKRAEKVAVNIKLASIPTEDQDKIDRLYGMQGYKQTDRYFTKRLDNA